MSNKLKGKSIVVTGAGRGIGRELALLFAEEGARIVVADYGAGTEGDGDASQAPADEVVAEIRERGGEAVPAYDDIATIAGGENVVQTAIDNFGRLDGLVCNAGVLAPLKPLWDVSEEEWNTVLRINLNGHFCPIRAAVPVMRQQGSGRLIYFSSSAAMASDHGVVGDDASCSPYGAAKAGLLGLMLGTALEYAQYGITSNAIFPGATTRLVDARLPDTEEGAALRSENASGTWLDPKHIAPIVAYLLSDAGASVNGQMFGAMGGRLANYQPIEPKKVINAEEGLGFSTDELFRRFPAEFGAELNFKQIPFPPPVSDSQDERS